MTAVPDPLLVETVVLDGLWRVADAGGHGERYRISWFDPPFRPRPDVAELDTDAFAEPAPCEQEEAVGALAGERFAARLSSPPRIRRLATLERGGHAHDR